MLLSAFAEIASIGMIIPFLTAITSPDVILANPTMNSINQFFNIESQAELVILLTSIFCLLAVLSASMRLVTLWFQTRFCYSVGENLSTQLYKNTLYQSYSMHVSRNSSEFISTIINKTFQSTSFAILPILNIFSSGLILLAIIITLIFIQPLVAISAFLLFGFAYGIVIFLTRSKLDSDSKKISTEQDQVVKKLQEGFGSIRDILVSSTQEVYLRSYTSSYSALQRAWANVEIIRATPRFVIEALGIIIIALCALFFYDQPGGIAEALPVLGVMALGAQRMLPILQIIYASFTSLRAGLASLADIFSMLQQPTNEELIKGPKTPIFFKNQIRIENLKFRYSPDTDWILNGIDLIIPKGSMTGIMGTTGSGKSTLIDILMGLLHPSAGSFQVDGEPITEINKYGWQAQLAHVPQSIFLLDASIAANIALGVPLEHIDYDLVRESAKKARIHEAVTSWTNQYETIVGERGIRISGGQRQRIAIARALYKKASIIIFDEATSALDSETETAVMEAITSLSNDITIILVAHRLSTLKECSNIIELSDGKIARQGIYDEIVAG
jgi:ATP-binding cassette, subfamily B, bacterial PglK